MEHISKITQQKNYTTMLPALSQEQWAVEIRNKYGTGEQFLITFNPGKQYDYIQLLERCFMGTAPSVIRVAKTYGMDVAKSWIMVQVMDLAEFSGIKEKPTVESLLNLSSVIMANFGYLKVTELMVFFHKFKAGEYGKFYGVFDNIVITTALNDFLTYRKQVIDTETKRIEEENRFKIWKDANENGITHEEYIKRKNTRRNDQNYH